MMKYLYLVDYWVPFPSSEYGGTVSVIASNDTECHDILRDSSEQMNYDARYESKILEAVVKAPRFALADNEQPRIVESFTT
jgi:hypothetical protein